IALILSAVCFTATLVIAAGTWNGPGSLPMTGVNLPGSQNQGPQIREQKAALEDFKGHVSKIETKDGKSTLSGKKDGTDFSITVSEKIKVFKGITDKDQKIKAGDEIENGLKNDMFKNVSPENMIICHFNTDKNAVTSILVLGKPSTPFPPKIKLK